MMMTRLIVFGLCLVVSCGGNARSQQIIIGQTQKLGFGDGGNANLVLAQGPYNLAQTATLTSLSFYVSNAAGKLTLGIYTAGSNNDCAGGRLVAQTSPFITKANSWNTALPKASVTLNPGNYCLAYMPNNNNLTFLKGMVSGIIDPYFIHSFGTGALPATFSTHPSQSSGDGFSWSLYATLMAVNSGQTPLSVQFNPSSASVLDSAPSGTVLSSVLVQTSDGNPFSGAISILSQTVPGMTALSSSALPANVQVVSINSSDDGAQSATIQACENNVCQQATLAITVNPSPSPTLSVVVTPAAPSISDLTPDGTVVATLQGVWSNGAMFTGTYGFSGLHNDDSGTFALSGANLIINPAGPGVAGDGGTIQSVTVIAVQ